MVLDEDTWKKIRYKFYVEHRSKRGIARDLEISRNTVRDYLETDKEPGNRGHETHRSPVMTDKVKGKIDELIKKGKDEDPKHPLTAKRIYDLLVEDEELGFKGSETSVRVYVATKKPCVSNTFIPLFYKPGMTMQVDFGETKARIRGKLVTIYFFCARLCYSTAPFVKAYRRQTQECFLDGINEAIKFFGGVPKEIVFDNGSVGVKDGHGKDAVPTDEYKKMSEYYAFTPVFCNPASGNEKGLVEGLIGYGRRNYFRPYPVADSMDDLNEMLRARCVKDRDKKAYRRGGTVGELLIEEQELLTKFPRYEFDIATRKEETVSSYSAVKFETNYYSVPCKYTSKKVVVRAYPEKVSIYCDGKVIAEHERLLGRNGHNFVFEHYAELLAMRPRALKNAGPIWDSFSESFRTWIFGQNLTPKGTVELMERALQVGCDVVMQEKIDTDEVLTPTNDVPADIDVEVADPEEYDKIFGLGEDNDEGSVGCANRNMREKS